MWEVYGGTFARYGYTSDQVARSYDYYHADPKVMVARYEVIMDSLKARTHQLSRPLEP